MVYSQRELNKSNNTREPEEKLKLGIRVDKATNRKVIAFKGYRDTVKTNSNVGQTSKAFITETVGSGARI